MSKAFLFLTPQGENFIAGYCGKLNSLKLKIFQKETPNNFQKEEYTITTNTVNVDHMTTWYCYFI